ncbi:MAG: ABC transporter ATP-binding protein [Actinobacteria bacterium]|nr:ABC transporter ATP-binding protein [Actinomycetota bacterium]
MVAVEFQGVTKEYHRQPVLTNVNFTIEAGTFAVIFGAPACGKSVLVRLLTGLEKPTAGRVFLRGVDVTNVSPGERNIGYVPQEFALYPHYSVYDNIAYPLKLMGVRKSEIKPVVQQAAELLRITHLLGKKPNQLSGGEKQRVAIARGIVKRTEIYVLDDPLTGLDFKLREQLFDDLKQMQESLQATFVYTTSDPLETLMLAEQIEVIDGGRVVEYGPLEQVYWRPEHVRTMELLGFPRANLIAGDVVRHNGQIWCRSKVFESPVQLAQFVGSAGERPNVTVAIRAQDIMLEPEHTDGLLTGRARIILEEDLGGELLIHLDADGTPLIAVLGHHDDHLPANGAVTIGVHPWSLVVYTSEEGRRIGQGAEVSHV